MIEIQSACQVELSTVAGGGAGDNAERAFLSIDITCQI
jgi:hypothetical protein